MKQKLKLLAKVHSIVYRHTVLKNAFAEYLPFKLHDTRDVFSKAQFKAADFESALSTEDYVDLLIHLKELKEYNMYSQADYNKQIYSTYIKGILHEYKEKFPNLKLIINELRDIANNSCLVGGAVRDIVANCNINYDIPKVKDFDFVTDATYDHVIKMLSKVGFKIDETGKKFLVIRATKDYDTYEIACYRKDGTYTDGRRPESVDIGDIFTDSARRDFTVNSLYYDLNKEVLLDPTGMGVEDASMDILRFNGNPDQRIKDDYLRVFRAYRFIAKGYMAEARTMNALRSNFETALRNTDHNRIREELERTVGL